MVRGELKVSWWVCYVVIRTLLMGFSSRFFSFSFFFFFCSSTTLPFSLPLSGKVSNEARGLFAYSCVPHSLYLRH